MFQRFSPYIPTGQTVPAPNCPGWLSDIWPGMQSYLPVPPVTTTPAPTTVLTPAPTQLPAPAPAFLPVVVDREIGCPEIAALGPDAACVVLARSECLAIPTGATRFSVSFSPASAYPCYGDAPTAFPCGLDGPAHGPLHPGQTQLHVTPAWARLTGVSVRADSVRATLRVQFT